MSAEAFFDMKVLVHHLDSSDARKPKIAEELLRRALDVES
jgi:hypothetical protein